MLLTHMLGKCTNLAYIGLMGFAIEGKGLILMFGAWIELGDSEFGFEGLFYVKV